MNIFSLFSKPKQPIKKSVTFNPSPIYAQVLSDLEKFPFLTWVKEDELGRVYSHPSIKYKLSGWMGIINCPNALTDDERISLSIFVRKQIEENKIKEERRLLREYFPDIFK